MTVPQPGLRQLFLRDDDLRSGMDLMYRAMRDFADAASSVRNREALSRTQQWLLHALAQDPPMPVGDLARLLDLTKQSLGRAMDPLVARGLVAVNPGRQDRRQRLVSLTEAGQVLERQLYEAQRAALAAAYRAAGAAAVEGLRTVLLGLLSPSERARFEAAGSAAPQRNHV